MNKQNEYAAANKAAEEGGLPDEGFLYGHFRKNGKHFDMLKGRPNVHTLSSGWVPLYTTKEAADRASRQVANKAEVEPEPFGYVKFRAAQNISPEGDVDANEWYEFCEQEEMGDDKLPAFPLYATPPATTGGANATPTGASTVLTDERKRALFEEWATKQGGYDLSPYKWRLKSIGGVPYTGYVRPYKQDRTVHAFEGFVAALGEVAAQAGQVAVPDFRNVTEVKRISDQSLTITFASCASCSKFERAAAPSPAKESK